MRLEHAHGRKRKKGGFKRQMTIVKCATQRSIEK
jgi:hypothetical protein